MEDRIMKLYNELDFLLNNSPVEDDCSDEQNEMYSDMANLKESIERALFLYVYLKILKNVTRYDMVQPV